MITPGSPNALFLGSQVVYLVVSADGYNYNVKTQALASGWNGTDPITINLIVNSGIYIGSVGPGAYSLVTGTGYPAGSRVVLINNGFIVGAGGTGGVGGDTSGINNACQVGNPGGPALLASISMVITNNGTIGGGGGGAGGGASGFYGLGGGGGAGYDPGLGGGPYGNSAGGAPGTRTAGGFPGGGGLGASGSSGSPSPYQGGLPFFGGAGGAAVNGNSNIFWNVTGIRLGSIT